MRNQWKYISAIIVSGAMSLPGTADAQATVNCGTTAPLARCQIRTHRGLNVAGFAAAVANGMNTLPMQPKGYSIAFYGANGDWDPVLTVSRGQAAGGADPLINFTPTVGSALASVSKVFTEAAVRHAIEVNQETTARSACPVTKNTLFLSVLPDAFRRAAAAGGGIAGLSYYAGSTIDDVLEHKAGIPNNATLLPDGTYDYYEMMVRPAGKRTCNAGTVCYSNDNYVVATTFLPLLLDCSLRATFEAEATAQCAGQSAGKNRDSCQIQYAFTRLGNLSNSIVQSMIMDVMSRKTSCYPEVLMNAGIPVARGYADANAQNGFYIVPGNNIRACGVGGWHMPAEDLGRFLKRFWDGSFFNHKPQRGFLTQDQNGFLGGYSAWAYHIADNVNGESLSMAMVTSSPVAQWEIKPFVDAAFAANRVAAPALPDNIMTWARQSTWKCVQDEATWNNQVWVRVSNALDIKLFNGLDFSNQGSEENWTTTASDANTASGEYLWYRATSSPITGPVWRGRWTMNKIDNGARMKIKRVDNATGWTGNYTCTWNADW